jgi:hypothetical protein
MLTPVMTLSAEVHRSAQRTEAELCGFARGVMRSWLLQRLWQEVVVLRPV